MKKYIYIYIIVNKLNNKYYINNTRLIKVRLYSSFNIILAVIQKEKLISSTILKYKLINFAFIIIKKVDLNVYNLEKR